MKSLKSFEIFLSNETIKVDIISSQIVPTLYILLRRIFVSG